MSTPKPRPAPVMSQICFSVMTCSSFWLAIKRFRTQRRQINARDQRQPKVARLQELHTDISLNNEESPRVLGIGQLASNRVATDWLRVDRMKFTSPVYPLLR